MLLTMLVLSAAACAHAPVTGGGEAARSSAGAQVIISTIEPLPPDLLPWLTDALMALASRDPVAALPYFSAENRATQREIGITDDAQYVIEGLGVALVGHVAGPELPNPIDYAALLSGLESILVQGVSAHTDANGTVIDGWIVVRGEVRFAGGTRYRMELQVLRTDGGFTIAPPLG
jgi:hypothetical protein